MNPNYPDKLAVYEANQATVAFYGSLNPRPRMVAEIGCYRGYTTRALLSLMPQDGELHLYDFTDTLEAVIKEVADPRVKGFGNSTLVLDSYNWSLMKVLAANPAPIYDYVMIDGAHTWHHDALAFLLVDRLLKPGGYMDFDDYNWTLAGSPTLNPAKFPKTAEWYTAEQIAAPQVQLIVSLLVRRDPRYTEVVPNRIYQKAATK